jgi:DNA-directed RNA polymerase specialized sigma24 family protein
MVRVRKVDKPAGMSYAEIARKLSLTEEEVKRIEALALWKCRDWCRRNGLDLADLLEHDDA